MALTSVKQTLFHLLILQTIIQCYCARTRLKNTLDVKFNTDCNLPQCTTPDTNKSAVNLFQVISSNPESPGKTNFIWSNIGGPPMVITSSSRQESSLNIDWDAILNNKQPSRNETSGFHFNTTQDSSLGLLLEKIILFDDTDQSGRFTKDKPHIEVEWDKLNWDLASKSTFNKDDFLKTFFRMRNSFKFRDGNLLIKLALPRDYRADRQKDVPHLKLNTRSISMAVIVDGIQPPADYKNARLAMTFVVIVQSTSDQVSGETDIQSMISDEYTPGMFRIKSLQFKTKQIQPPSNVNPETATQADAYAEIDGEPMTTTTVAPKSPSPNSSDKLGFIYWKEVAYANFKKIISRTIDVFDSEIEMSMDSIPKISPPFYHYYQYKPKTGPEPKYKLFRFELIFGKGDTTYSSTNHTDFSFVFGLGSAPQEQMFSVLVKIIIFVCFCLPILVMLAGLGYLMLRKLRRVGDTELLLAAES